VTRPGLDFGGAANGGPINGVTDSRHKRFMDVQANTLAFGVILLELISGRASLSKDTADLVDWVSRLLLPSMLKLTASKRLSLFTTVFVSGEEAFGPAGRVQQAGGPEVA
jgi:hypothetical protein